ncbi:MAG: 3-methyl-2-oxobutanoate dehydrogenase subunit VorB [Synergistaceae bacterium]|jgi:2-oxoglutarate ferredoxin oxidoreductase subunit alpha|nr:3-methyl-2-oxobutanoate dehydrogenase subunit VorB [Synergistaceae bacterium]
MKRALMKGTEAIAEAAIQAGCKYFFGYPITPQNEIPEYMSARLPQVGGTYLQAESEVASINMVMGGAATGYRVMTTSSSPGISLMSEGISYIAMAELPCVIVNISRGGPGLGNILPAQGDYNQATRGGGHGDYHLVVLAPGNLQEAVDFTQDAFDISQKYRTPVLLLADGFMGQMMEAVEIKPRKVEDPASNADWALGWWDERGSRRSNIYSMQLEPDRLEKHNTYLQEKFARLQANEFRFERYKVEDAELLLTSYGTTSRVCRSAINNLREEGYKVGMMRPMTLWPFPAAGLSSLPNSVKCILDVEMSPAFPMVDDVRLATSCSLPIATVGRWGGFSPSVRQVEEKCKELLKH